MKLFEACLAPVVLAGALLATEVTTKVQPETQDKTGQGALLELMTCERGWGAGLKASTNGLYDLHGQYGVGADLGDFSFSLIPKVGLSAVDHKTYELPQTVQYSIGAQLLLGYQDFRAGIELWHLSNGDAFGLNVSDKGENVGLNMVAVTAGWRF